MNTELKQHNNKIKKKTTESLKNVAGMDRHGKELSQIRKGEVMFLDKTEPGVVSVVLLRKDQALICCFLCCVLSATAQLLSQKPPQVNGECSN